MGNFSQLFLEGSPNAVLELNVSGSSFFFLLKLRFHPLISLYSTFLHFSHSFLLALNHSLKRSPSPKLFLTLSSSPASLASQFFSLASTILSPAILFLDLTLFLSSTSPTVFSFLTLAHSSFSSSVLAFFLCPQTSEFSWVSL